MFKLVDVFIIYFLILQKSMALFICEAEYIAFTEADCETVHFYEFL